MSEVIFAEKYRPKTIGGCVLPDRIKSVLEGLKESKELPHLLFHGPAGTGKTTSAIALCNEMNIEYMIINGSKERNIDVLRTKIADFAMTVSMVGDRKCVIIDEADYLNAQSTQPALRNFMQEHSDNCSFILTCNYPNRIMPELHSRCMSVDFNFRENEKQDVIKMFLKRLGKILRLEKIEYDIRSLAMVVMKLYPDFRQILNVVQMHARMNGNRIDSSILSIDVVKDEDIERFMKILRTKPFPFDEAEKWSIDHAHIPFGELAERIYNELRDYLDDNVKATVATIINIYDEKNSRVMLKHINLLSMLIELYEKVKFKDEQE